MLLFQELDIYYLVQYNKNTIFESIINMKLVHTLAFLIVIASVIHCQVIDDDDDFGFDYEEVYVPVTRTESNVNIDTKISESKEVEVTYPLYQRFISGQGPSSSVDASNLLTWEQRGDLVIVKSENNEVRRVDITNTIIEDLSEVQKAFDKHCTAGDKYQLLIKELGLFTTISSCAYIENGGTDALVFSLTPAGSIISFSYQKSYTKYKKAPKKWVTEGLVRKIEEGPRPQYKFKAYDVFGKQKIDEKEVNKAKQEDAPWYSKYWWAILIGVILFMQLLH